ncbi:MAG: InlB B-repeat-containing protein, partial [Clostridia bacterium]
MKKHISKIMIAVLLLVTVVSLVACNPGGGGGGGGGDDSYEKATFTVAFTTDGGTLFPSQTVKYGEKLLKPTTSPTKSGYNFKYWSSSGAAGAEYDFSLPVIKKMALTAVYTPIVYKNKLAFFEEADKNIFEDKVVYNNGEGKPITEFESTFGATLDNLTVPTIDKDKIDAQYKDDYFVYWYYKSEKDGKPIEVQFTTWAALQKDAKEPTVSYLSKYYLTDNPAPTLYAKWHSRLKDFNITFNQNTENTVTNMPITTTKKEQDKVVKFYTDNGVTEAKPTRAGYDFKGWYYKETKKVDGKPDEIKNVDFVFDDGKNEKATVITKDLELFAKWEQHIEIANAEAFMALYSLTGDAKRDMAAANIYLVNDITISGNIAHALFDEEMPFTGVFDGGVDAGKTATTNRTITFRNLTLGDLTLQSLFGVSKGTIKNVNVINSNLSVVANDKTVYVGSLVSKNYGKITNCNVYNFNFNNSSLAGGKLVIGGITAINGVGAEISKCNVFGTATSEINGKNIIFGGIAGINTGLILRSNVTDLAVTVNAKNDSKSTVVGGLMAGGIVGEMSNSGSIKQSEFKNLKLTCTSAFDNANAGGVVGFMSSESAVSECFGNGAITVAAKGANAGGIAGRTNGTIQDCYVANCAVSATSDVFYARAGGIAGDTSTNGTRNIQIKQCYTGENVKIN